MAICDLILQTGADIPFIPLSTAIHQPTIKEISMIGGEEVLFKACQVFQLSKDNLRNKEDIKDLDKIKDFDIIMTVINGSDPKNLTYKYYVFALLSLLFPNFNIECDKKNIIFREDGSEEIKKLNAINFNEFRDILNQIFCLKASEDESYNPSGVLASQIAKKFEERKKKLQKTLKDNDNHFDIFSRYVSILNIGVGLDKNALSNYTVYQLTDSYNRYQLYSTYDIGTKIQLAGGKTDSFPDDWENWYKRLEN